VDHADVCVCSRESTARIERRERARDPHAAGGGGGGGTLLLHGVVRVIIGVEEDATTRRAVREASV